MTIKLSGLGSVNFEYVFLLLTCTEGIAILVKLLDPDHNFFCVFRDSGMSTDCPFNISLLVLKQLITWLSV